MTKARVTFRGELATVMLPKDVLAKAGIRDGDQLDVAVVDDAILLLTDTARAELLQQATDKVFDKYSAVFAALGEGVSADSREEQVEESGQDLIKRRADVYRALANDCD